jgi:hypothetical protein
MWAGMKGWAGVQAEDEEEKKQWQQQRQQH